MVYNEDKSGYTEEAKSFDKEIRNAIKDIIEKYSNQGFSLEAVMYIVNEAAHQVILNKRIKDVLKKMNSEGSEIK